MVISSPKTQIINKNTPQRVTRNYNIINTHISIDPLNITLKNYNRFVNSIDFKLNHSKLKRKFKEQVMICILKINKSPRAKKCLGKGKKRWIQIFEMHIFCRWKVSERI